ncbi:MAG: Gfo/Idh/MocA family oxidoreductase [Planctomycetota bacterium]
MPDPIRLVGINFDHQHMGDLLRNALDHPDVEIVGVWHTEPTKPQDTLDRLGLPRDLIFDDFDRCMTQARPDAAVLCSSTGTHAEYTEKIAAHGVHLLVEKPFAATLEQADRMAAAIEPTGKKLAINWPLAWYPPHRTTKRLIDEGVVGDLIEVHYYDGNRGPLAHKMDKLEVGPDQIVEEKKQSWFYKADQGGGSLLDYLGYGVTLGTWFNGGRKPIEVTATTFASPGLEVDEHSVTVARYAEGLSKFETRWGSFNNPWEQQPQPKCGFVVCGTAGTIASYDYEPTIRLQTTDDRVGRDMPVDELVSPFTGPIDYFAHCIRDDRPIEGPLSPAVCRIGQQIVDTAFASARQKKTLALIDR